MTLTGGEESPTNISSEFTSNTLVYMSIHKQIHMFLRSVTWSTSDHGESDFTEVNVLYGKGTYESKREKIYSGNTVWGGRKGRRGCVTAGKALQHS